MFLKTARKQTISGNKLQNRTNQHNHAHIVMNNNDKTTK